MYNIFYSGFSYSSTQAFNKYLLSHYHVWGPRLDVEDLTETKVDGVHFLLEYSGVAGVT